VNDIVSGAVDEALRDIIKQFAKNYFDGTMTLDEYEKSVARAKRRFADITGKTE